MLWVAVCGTVACPPRVGYSSGWSTLALGVCLLDHEGTFGTEKPSVPSTVPRLLLINTVPRPPWGCRSVPYKLPMWLPFPQVADRIEAAVTAALDADLRRGDIMQPGVRGMQTPFSLHWRWLWNASERSPATLYCRPSWLSGLW